MGLVEGNIERKEKEIKRGRNKWWLL